MDIKNSLLEIVENIRIDNWEWATIEFHGKYVQLTKLTKYSVSLEVLYSKNTNTNVELLQKKGYKEDWRSDEIYIKAVKLMEVKDSIVLEDEIKWIYSEVFNEHFNECHYSYNFEINNSHIQKTESFNKHKRLNIELNNILIAIIVAIIIGFIVGATIYLI
ncbi:MAG: hypothetical protein J6L20_00965 [Bacteroidales bacterium]|nr:hypothetical protein [Bacteroidales bacterium]